METQPQQNSNKSFLAKYKFTLLSLCIILIALVPLLIISKKTKNSTNSPLTTTIKPTVTPTPIPLTQQNAQPTLSATEQNIQSTLNQTNQDLNQVNQINTSQDSIAGL